MLSAACLAVGVDPSFGRVGADVFGAVSAGLAVFTAPPDNPGSAFGAFSYGAGLAAANVGSAAGRTIISVLLQSVVLSPEWEVERETGFEAAAF